MGPVGSATRRAVLRGIGLGSVAAALAATGWHVETVAQHGAHEADLEPNAIVILYGQPTDKVAFAEYYRNSHIPLALTLPSLQDTIVGPMLGKPDGDEGDDFWIAVLRYASADDLQASLASSAGKQVLADVRNFATGGVTIYLAHLDTETSGGTAATPVG
jgi:uncharacterized protein (TIGR02118 family)